MSQSRVTSEHSAIPLTYACDPEVEKILTTIDSGAPVIFVLGRAGTGKTTLIHYLAQRDKHVPQVVLAPTGVAALHVGGQTIHSFFKLPPQVLDEHALRDRRRNTLWTKIERIVIDEVSMVRVDVLDAIDIILRRARKDQRPFGGVQMILVGDFLQLPPVTPPEEFEMLALLGYQSPYAFSAKSIEDVEAKFVRLTTIHRQTDPTFIDILRRIRDKTDLAEALSELNQKCCRSHRLDRQPMLLTGTNARAAYYNDMGLRSINEPSQTYYGQTKGKFDYKGGRLPVPECLSFKPSARVMAVKNDPDHQWVNGSLGTVTSLEKDQVEVLFDDKSSALSVEPVAWENIRYRWNKERKYVEAEVIGVYRQIPLILAWAATIHKAQGLTLDDVRIDLESGAFASGQAYVAISRARSMDGLSLSREVRPYDVIVDPMLSDFERRIDEL